MGFNSVAVILNDAIGSIERDDKIGARIARAVSAFHCRDRDALAASVSAHVGRGIHVGAITVISQQHADWPQVVVVYGNTGWSLGDKDIPEKAERAVAEALERRGWKVTLPAKKKVHA